MSIDALSRSGRLDSYFGVTRLGSTMKRELMAGTVTFLAMSYVLAVNPSVLGDHGQLGARGIPTQAVFTATAVAAVVGTLVMGLWARYPIALAPGMGLNAFFAYSVVLGMGIDWQVALSGTLLSGIIFFVLAVLGWHGAVLYGIVCTTAVGIVSDLVHLPHQAAALPHGLDQTFGQAIINLPHAFTGQMAIVILTMLFVDFFDAFGTLIGIANQAGLLGADGKLPRAAQAFASDSIGTAAGAVIGTSTTTAYVESTAGVSAGGRTGLTAVSTAGWFLIALFFFPVFAVVADVPAVTAPALIVVGVLMSRALGDIDWSRIEYAIPAFITVIMMPLTYSIANGIAMGLTFYPIVMVARRRVREIHPVMWVLMAIFLAYFFFLAD